MQWSGCLSPQVWRWGGEREERGRGCSGLEGDGEVRGRRGEEGAVVWMSLPSGLWRWGGEREQRGRGCSGLGVSPLRSGDGEVRGRRGEEGAVVWMSLPSGLWRWGGEREQRGRWCNGLDAARLFNRRPSTTQPRLATSATSGNVQLSWMCTYCYIITLVRMIQLDSTGLPPMHSTRLHKCSWMTSGQGSA